MKIYTIQFISDYYGSNHGIYYAYHERKNLIL